MKTDISWTTGLFFCVLYYVPQGKVYSVKWCAIYIHAWYLAIMLVGQDVFWFCACHNLGSLPNLVWECLGDSFWYTLYRIVTE